MMVSVIIPVYNERDAIIEVIARVKAADTQSYDREIVVVDDGSTDGISEMLAAYSRENDDIRVRYLPENRGKAAAIKEALAVADGEIILIQDADLEYSPDDYRRLIKQFHNEDVNVVYGSRFVDTPWPRNMKLQNWLANRLFTVLVNLLYHARITDEGTAYKLFRKDVIQSIDVKSSGFEFCPEVTVKLRKKGVEITEVPVSYSARDRKKGKKPKFIDGIKVLWTIIKYRFVSQGMTQCYSFAWPPFKISCSCGFSLSARGLR